MIVEFTPVEIGGGLKKCKQIGDTSVPTQPSGRLGNYVSLGLGYFSDTGLMDKVAEKKQQYAELCKLVAAEG
jgi:hypothetical protein